MSALTLILAAFAVFGLLLVRWGWQEWKRYKLRRAFAQMTADIRKLQVAIGEALLPAMRNTAKAFEAFADAWNTLPEDVRQNVRDRA